jgi:hypothetical protein
MEACAPRAAATMKVSADNKMHEHPMPGEWRAVCLEMPTMQALDCIKMEETKSVLFDRAASPSDRVRYSEVASACDDHLAGIK